MLKEFILSKYVSILYRHNRSFMDRKLGEYNFGSGQYKFLFYLYHHNGATQDQISKDFEIDKATTARALSKLENGGFIVRKSDENDRRINHAFLTEKGQSVRNEMVNLSDEWKNMLLQGFTDEEILTLEKLFLRLSHNACLYKNEKDE